MKQDGEVFPDEVALACSLTATEHVTRSAELEDLFKSVQQVNELSLIHI